VTRPDDNVRPLQFASTAAVRAARAHNRFVACPACRADQSSYLFHRAGVRFVRCAACGAVYVNPTREKPFNDLDIERTQTFLHPRDRELMSEDFERLLQRVERDHQRSAGAPLQRTLLLGRYLPEFAQVPSAARLGLEVAEFDDARFSCLALDSDMDWADPFLARQPQVVILAELLESLADPHAVLSHLTGALPPETLFVITYTNADSMPARTMRRHWAQFFDHKSVFLSTGNLTALAADSGLVLKTQYPLPVTRTARYVGNIASRVMARPELSAVLEATPLGRLELPLRVGNRVAVFGRRSGEASAREKLSIVLPVYNEARYVADVIEAVLVKPLKIDRELIVVESNSTDGTRAIVERFKGRPGVRLIFEDRPRGKGHAVRTGLAHVTGTIVLIQDADFEYDIDDYDALLEPLLQHKTSFVLGSRSLGLDDWKVRKYDATPVRGLILNLGQLLFARTYSVLYQQRVTDVNTMFKVFRSECLDGLDLKSNGFELDIELACKLARNGHSPMEVPVNYVARGFAEGKKIRFWRDAVPSYASLFLHRF